MTEEQYSYNTGKVRSFGVADYVVLILTLLISAGIGVGFAIVDRRRNTPKDFLLGGKQMHVIPVSMSLSVTFLSALALLGIPSEIYNYNTMYWYMCASLVVALVMSAYIFIPFFYSLGFTSTFEYLELRFSRTVRVSGCLLLIAQNSIYMAFLLYAPSLALNAVTGIHLWGSVVGIGFVVTFYTALGGMKAVLWTDTFQAAVIVAGLLAVLIEGSIIQGGFDKAWDIANERGRVVFDEYSFDPKTRHSIWSVILGGWGLWVFLYGTNQAQVQRCLSCPTIEKARLAIMISLPVLIFIVTVCSMIGIVMLAFYKDCHPIDFGIIKTTDQLVPLYVMDILGDFPGLPGIFVSCVVSGSLSSISSCLNALSAITLSDLVEATDLLKLDDSKKTMLSKGLVLFYGVLTMVLAYGVSFLGSILQAIHVVSSVSIGPLLGVFTLGMFFPWANKHGASAGMLVSIVFLLWIGIAAFVYELETPKSPVSISGCNFTARPTEPTPLSSMASSSTSSDVNVNNKDPFIDLYRMSYMYSTPLGMVLVHVVGLIVSFLTGYTRPSTLDPKLICPFVTKLLSYLSEKWKDCPCRGFTSEVNEAEKQKFQIDVMEDDDNTCEKTTVNTTLTGNGPKRVDGGNSDNNVTQYGAILYRMDNEKGVENERYLVDGNKSMNRY